MKSPCLKRNRRNIREDISVKASEVSRGIREEGISCERCCSQINHRYLPNTLAARR